MTHNNEISTGEMNTMPTVPSWRRKIASSARFSTMLLFVLTSSGAALAQWTPFATPKYEVSGSFSYTRAYGTNSGAFNLPGGSGEFTYHLRHWLAATGDAGAYMFRGLPSGVTSNMYTYAGGPRISFRNYRHFTPFAQALAGAGRLTATSGGVHAAENGIVVLAGAGVDLPLSHGFAIRAGQAEYMLTKFALSNGSPGTQHNLRLSFGVVFRFGDK